MKTEQLRTDEPRVVLSVRIPESLNTWLRERARTDNVSLAALVTDLLARRRSDS